MFYDGKTVVVTGGTGLVGTHIVQELLKTNAKIIVVVHKRPPIIKDNRITSIRADLLKYTDCLKVVKNADFVFHAAGNVFGAGAENKDIISGITSYIAMTVQLLNAAVNSKVKRVLIFSSSTVYPLVNHPIREEEMWNGPVHPSYFGYGWMRRYIELLSTFISSKSNMKIAIVRPTAIYGQWDNFDLETSHVIPALIRKAVEKQNPYRVWGSGEEMRDFLYVSDLARGALLMLGKNSNCDPVNIGYGKSYKIKEIVKIILKYAGHHNAKVVFDNSKPTNIPYRMVDISKAKKLGWAPKISLDQGIQKTIAWYRKYFGAPFSK